MRAFPSRARFRLGTFMPVSSLVTLKRSCAILAAAALSVGILSAPASAASTQTINVNLTVNASVATTIGVSYSSGNIACNVTGTVSSLVACTSTAIITGYFRSSQSDPGGTSVGLTAANIVGTSNGSIIAPTAFRMTCTGGTTGSPAAGFTGTPGT